MPLHRYNTAPRLGVPNLNKYVPKTVPNTQRRRNVFGETNFGTPTTPPMPMGPGMEQKASGSGVAGGIGGDAPWNAYGLDDFNQIQMLSGFGTANNSMIPGSTGIQSPIGIADPNSPMLPGQGMGTMGTKGWSPNWGTWGIPPGILYGFGGY